MKVFFSFAALTFFLTAQTADAQQVPYFQEPVYETVPVNYHPFAPETQSKRSAIEQMVWDNKVRCGSNLSVKSFAYKEDGVWHGIDADLCRIIAQALLGDNKKIVMVNVSPKNMSRALDEGKIDVMLSSAAYTARTETSREALGAGFLYYDRQMLMARSDDSDDIENYRGKQICVTEGSDYFKNFDDYNTKYNLGIKYLTFGSMEKAKEAFLLKRCQLLTASGLMLQGIKKTMPENSVKLLPIKISLYPVYAYVQRDNAELRLALKWIFNALFLAEQYGINAQNLNFYINSDKPEIRNLMGDDEQMWSDLKVRPAWLKDVIKLFGNYADIFDKDLGSASEYNFERGEGKLVKDGGTIYPVPFN